MVREIQSTTKRNKEPSQPGQAGWKIIGFTGAMRFWQITITDNSKAPQQTYTALVPDDFDQGEISKNQLAFIALRGVNWGSFSAWIVTFLAPAK
ncbi:hypothetical protein HJC10_11265 [Corallococcus exiguus]|nr:hypothetical protein [Corallococcus exiguus]